MAIKGGGNKKGAKTMLETGKGENNLAEEKTDDGVILGRKSSEKKQDKKNKSAKSFLRIRRPTHARGGEGRTLHEIATSFVTHARWGMDGWQEKVGRVDSRE